MLILRLTLSHCRSQVAVIVNGVLKECAESLTRNMMDDYAFELLDALKHSLDTDGDGDIDAHEVVEVMHNNGVLEDPTKPVIVLRSVHHALFNLIDAHDNKAADSNLDALAESLLGVQTVGDLKIVAITAAIQKCALVFQYRGVWHSCRLSFLAVNSGCRLSFWLV